MGINVYLSNELNQKEPQKIIDYFIKCRYIERGETVVAVTGGTNFLGVYSSIVVLKDRMVSYNLSGSNVDHPFTVTFSDFLRFETKAERPGNRLVFIKKDGVKLASGVMLKENELRKFVEFIDAYKIQRLENADPASENKKTVDSGFINPIYNIYAEKMSRVIKNEFKSKHMFHFEMNFLPGADESLEPEPCEISINMNEPVVKIQPSKSPEIKIPFRNILGCSLKTDKNMKELESSHKHTFFIHIKYLLSGKETEITISHSQKQFNTFDDVQTLYYAIQHNDELYEDVKDYNHRFDDKIEQLADERVALHQRMYELFDSRPETHYHMDYLSGSDEFGIPGSAKLTLDKTALKVSLPNTDINIPLENITGCEISEDCQKENAELNDETLFYLTIHFVSDNSEHEMHFSHKQKHDETLDQVGQLNYLLRKHCPLLSDSTKPKTQPEVTQIVAVSPADELRKYKSLLDDGIITQEEFDAKKKQLLGLS